MAQNIPKDFIDNLLERANIVDIIGNYIKLEKKGNDYWSNCPFHSEKTSSFSVSENKQFYHCFGCGAHGNSIGFIMEHTNKTFPEAIEALANTLGVEIPRDKETNKLYETQKIIHNCLKDSQKIFTDQLKVSNQAIAYLKNRNIKGETAKVFNLGYSEDSFQSLKVKLNKNYSESNLLDAGLIAKKNNNSYDKFRGRIMFPINDHNGKIIAFGGRILVENKEKAEAKYMNSPETKLFSKKKILYNLHLAKQEKISKDYMFIVEGYMDVIALYQAGIKNVVATLGTAVTKENLTQCFKYTREIICCFDGDNAGEKAAWQGVENIMPVIKDGDVISFVFLPKDNDPDNIVEKGGRELWDQQIRNKISIEEFIYRRFSKEFDLSTAAGKTQYLKRINSLLNNLSAKILKNMLLVSLNEKIGSKYDETKDNSSPKIKQKKYKTTSPLQKAILILLHHPNISVDEKLIRDNHLKDNIGIKIIKSILELTKKNKNMNIGRIIENFREDENIYSSLNKISMMPIPKYDFPDKEFHAYIYLVIKNLLKDKLDEIDPSNLEKTAELNREIREIDKKSKNF